MAVPTAHQWVGRHSSQGSALRCHARRPRQPARSSRPAPRLRPLVVPTKYRERYEDGSCGDDLALKLKKHITTDDGTIDLAKLRALAEANDVWEVRYAKLNAGLARMTIGNKLRARARNGSKIAWKS